jgi:hypothetical protein
MAYATKYYLEHFSNAGIPYTLQLQKDGFVGTPERLKLVKGGLVINYDLKAWEESIMTLVVQLQILNDASNWYAYEDLFTLEDKEFKLIIDASYNAENKRIFDGWINSSPVNQKYINNSTINLSGSNFIQKMDKVSPPILYTKDASEGDCINFINLVNSSLQLTGKYDDIMVNCRLEPSLGAINNTSTLFNRAGINPQLFFDDNQNKTSGLDIVESILKPFNCYLYWWGGDWYIERYKDLFPTGYAKKYVKYNWDVSYGYDTPGTYSLQTDPSFNLPVDHTDGSMVFTGSSQTMSMIPGLEFLEIELKESPILNLTINDFSGIKNHLWPYLQFPPFRGWCATRSTYTGGNGWDFPGFSTDISNTETSLGYSFVETKMLRYPSAPPTSTSQFNYNVGPGNPYYGIDNAIVRFGVVKEYYGGGLYHKWRPDYTGFSTKISYTVKSEKATLNLKWKFKPIHINECSASVFNVREYDYRCYYYIRPLLEGMGGAIWIMENKTDGYWWTAPNSTFNTYAQYVDINGADLDENGIANINVPIPIGDVSGYVLSDGSTGDGGMIFVIGAEKVRKSGTTIFPDWGTCNCSLPFGSIRPDMCFVAAYGDVEITADSGGDKAANKIIAQINNNVLNSEKITFNIYDTDNLLLENGPKTGGFPYWRYSQRTSVWRDEGGTDYKSIIDWYIHDRFQLYNRNRRELSGTLSYAGYLKPMSLWFDNYDPSTRQYILSSYSYNVGEDLYNCTWMEYDNSMVVNLNKPAGRRPEDMIDPATSRRDRSTRGVERQAPTRRVTPSTATRDRRR